MENNFKGKSKKKKKQVLDDGKQSRILNDSEAEVYGGLEYDCCVCLVLVHKKEIQGPDLFLNVEVPFYLISP